MHNVIMKIKKTFLSKKFIKFCVLGGINSFNNAFVSWAAHFVIDENIAAALGYFFSLTIGFFLSCKFVFKKHPTVQRYIRFGISYIPSFIIFFLITFITFDTLGMGQFWGTALAAVLGGPLTFIIIRLYAFGGRKHKIDNHK